MDPFFDSPQRTKEMSRASTTQSPARLDDILIDDTADVELCVRAKSSNSGSGRNSPRQGGRRLPSSSPSRESRSKTPRKKHLWVPPPLTIPETNPRQPVDLTTLSYIVKDHETPEEEKATALFEMAIHSKEGERKYGKARSKAVRCAPDSEVPAFVQVADEYREHYRQHRPLIYRHDYHTGLCDSIKCNKLLVTHVCCFPCAVQGMYDAINDPGFTSCSVPCQAALFAPFPCTWPVFCCAQAYVLGSKLNLIFGVRESYHLYAKSLLCPCCLTASMHREIELRRVPVLIRTPCSSAPQRVYESELLAPDIAHMGACGELVIPLPTVRAGGELEDPQCGRSSVSSANRYALTFWPTLSPPDAECCLGRDCCPLTAPYNSTCHLLMIGCSAVPSLLVTVPALGVGAVYAVFKLIFNDQVCQVCEILAPFLECFELCGSCS